MWHQKSYFWLPRLSGVTMAMSLSESIRDILKLSFYMFPYNEILKVFKNKIGDRVSCSGLDKVAF